MAAEQIADDVWVLRGGAPTKIFNVYFVREGDGVVLFDAGIKAMLDSVRAEGDRLGGITRVVLGHAHSDHRGVAAGLGAPVFCHPDEQADAEGDGGLHYIDFSKAAIPMRWLLPRAQRHVGWRASNHRRDRRRGRPGRLRVRGRTPAGQGARADWAVACRRPPRPVQRRGLHDQPVHRPEGDQTPARLAGRVQHRHRPGASVGAKARGARAGDGVGGSWRPAAKRRAGNPRARGQRRLIAWASAHAAAARSRS